MLYRKFYDELVKWHKQEKKLALLIDGARQIGKTTLIRQFAKDYYGDNFVEINFINTPSAKEIFAGDISVDGIISIPFFGFLIVNYSPWKGIFLWTFFI